MECVKSDAGDYVMEGITSTNCVKRDRGDYVEFVPKPGVVLNREDFVLVAENDQLKMIQKLGSRQVYSAPLPVFKFPKKVPENMTLESLKKQVIEEAEEKFSACMKEAARKAIMEKARIKSREKPQGLGENSNSNSNSMVRDHNILAMKELNSALDNCAEGNCAACGGTGCFNELKVDDMEE